MPTQQTTAIIFVPYTYTIVSAALAGNGQGITPLVMDEDADFELHWIIGSSTQDDPTAIYNNNFSVQISDKSNGRVWSSARVPQAHISTNFGSLRFPRPVLLARRTSLSIDFLYLSGQTNTVTVTLQGVKLKTA